MACRDSDPWSLKGEFISLCDVLPLTILPESGSPQFHPVLQNPPLGSAHQGPSLGSNTAGSALGILSCGSAVFTRPEVRFISSWCPHHPNDS